MGIVSCTEKESPGVWIKGLVVPGGVILPDFLMFHLNHRKGCQIAIAVSCVIVCIYFKLFLFLNKSSLPITKDIYVGNGKRFFKNGSRSVSSVINTTSDDTTADEGIIIPTVSPPLDIAPPLTSQYKICVLFDSRLGNQMFQFASNFGIAATRNMSVWVAESGMINSIFELNRVSFKKDQFLYDNCVQRKEMGPMRVYFKSLADFTYGSNYAFRKYLQSWKYFYNSSLSVRRQFIFKPYIIVKRNTIIYSVLMKYNLTMRSQATLIGVHVRRGDFLYTPFKYVANKQYLEKAVNHFLSKNFSKPIFIVCSDGMEWTKDNMPKGINVEFVSETLGVDMAVLASCDHMISTVGTFSWWAAWLTGGEVTYYQFSDIKGAPLRKPFPRLYQDFFHPGWIGFS